VWYSINMSEGRSLLKLVGSLLSGIRRVLAVVEQQEKGAPPQSGQTDEAEEQQSRIPPFVRAAVQIPGGVEIRKSEAETTKEASYQLWTLRFSASSLIIAVLTLISLIVYACITKRMWTEMQTQTTIQRATEINSERAWVGLDVPITIDAVTVEGDRVAIKGHYSVKNFGHGPAVKVIQVGDFVDDPSNLKMTGKEADFYCDSSVKFATGTVPVRDTLQQPPPFGYTLFPDKWHDEPIEYNGPVSTTKFFQFVGCVAYIDQFKAVHWTKFCMMRKPGNTDRIPKLDFCSLYNDSDSKPNEKIPN
jgi:hypothetical protein